MALLFHLIVFMREPLFDSVHAIALSCFHPAASENFVHSAAISGFPSLQGKKIHSFIAITSFNQWFPKVNIITADLYHRGFRALPSFNRPKWQGSALKRRLPENGT